MASQSPRLSLAEAIDYTNAPSAETNNLYNLFPSAEPPLPRPLLHLVGGTEATILDPPSVEDEQLNVFPLDITVAELALRHVNLQLDAKGMRLRDITPTFDYHAPEKPDYPINETNLSDVEPGDDLPLTEQYSIQKMIEWAEPAGGFKTPKIDSSRLMEHCPDGLPQHHRYHSPEDGPEVSPLLDNLVMLNFSSHQPLPPAA